MAEISRGYLLKASSGDENGLGVEGVRKVGDWVGSGVREYKAQESVRSTITTAADR